MVVHIRVNISNLYRVVHIRVLEEIFIFGVLLETSFHWRPTINENPNGHLVGKPQIFVGDPHIFIGDPQIFIGDPILSLETPYFHWRHNIFVKDRHIWGPWGFQRDVHGGLQ